jgi:hypothetical protein
MYNIQQILERRFETKTLVAIFGASIPWNALFGAFIDALSIIPIVFDINGGGQISAGMGIMGPI